MKTLFTTLIFLLTVTIYGQQQTDSSLSKIQEDQAALLEQRVDNIEEQLLSVKHNDFESTIGGAARLNYSLRSWDKDQMNKGGEVKFDVFFLNLSARYKDLSIHTRYLFYPKSSGGPMLKNAYFQYILKENHIFQLGIMEVPFGNPINSNSFYFSLAYYVGLEGDDDTGVKYTYNNKHFEIDAAFFKNSDIGSGSDQPTDPDRYGVDVSGQNQEINQFNGRFIWKLGESAKSRIGVSGMYSGLYNIYTNKKGTRYSVAAHYQLDVRNWTLRAQWANYGFDPKNLAAEEVLLEEKTEIETPGTITVSSYGSPFRLAAKGNLYTASLMYSIPIEKDILKSINVYGEFNYLDKKEKLFADTQMHVVGVNFDVWKVAIYVEYILAKNQPHVGDDLTNALGAGNPDAKWNHLLNINFGFYF